ncbi:hypothetical protein RJ55_05573 [Drechmeria coniospora]|nr:hypothetical protein RJ55_05573 [Drechmeria coniospora]
MAAPANGPLDPDGARIHRTARIAYVSIANDLIKVLRRTAAAATAAAATAVLLIPPPPPLRTTTSTYCACSQGSVPRPARILLVSLSRSIRRLLRS